MSATTIRTTHGISRSISAVLILCILSFTIVQPIAESNYVKIAELLWKIAKWAAAIIGAHLLWEALKKIYNDIVKKIGRLAERIGNRQKSIESNESRIGSLKKKRKPFTDRRDGYVATRDRAQETINRIGAISESQRTSEQQAEYDKAMADRASAEQSISNIDESIDPLSNEINSLERINQGLTDENNKDVPVLLEEEKKKEPAKTAADRAKKRYTDKKAELQPKIDAAQAEIEELQEGDD